MTLFELLFSPAKLFEWRPDAALVVSVAFALAFVVLRLARRRWTVLNERPMLVASALWAILALNEAMARGQDVSLRVDLVFLWPVVLGVTVLCIALSAASAVAASRMRPEARKED
jgi:hypothetical protein